MKTRKPKQSKRKNGTDNRKTFMLDAQSRQDAELIQKGLRATTASEAIRFSVRKMAELMGYVAQGGKILVHLPRRGTMVIDIPRAEVSG